MVQAFDKRATSSTLANIVSGMAKAGLGTVAVRGLPWGDRYGTKMDEADLAAVLPPNRARGLGDDEDWETALWEQLLEDPLFELRVAATRVPTSSSAMPLPGDNPPDIEASTRLLSMAASAEGDMPGGMTAAEVKEACAWLAQEATLREAAVASGDVLSADFRDAIARSLAAHALALHRGQAGVGPDALFLASARSVLVADLAGRFAPDTRGLPGWLAERIKGFALAQVTAVARRRRTGFIDGASPRIGDVIFYQRRGDRILTSIEVEISKCVPPVVVLGHSLGGIMLVDLLSLADPPAVARLITVGSQSPVLFKHDALANLRLNAPARPFVPWLNVFDRNDLLSFCAQRVFSDVPGIEDFEVASGSPFPELRMVLTSGCPSSTKK